MTQIGIIMGSNSDWPVMRQAAQFLEEFGVEYEARVVSAHRTPDLMFQYAETARGARHQSHHRGCGRRGAFTRHGCRQDHRPRFGRTRPQQIPARRRFAFIDCTNAQRRTRRHIRHRRGRRGKCRIVRRFHAGQRKPRTGAKTGRLPSQTGTGCFEYGIGTDLKPAVREYIVA